MKKYLLYVRFALSGLSVYEVETNDVFHCMGEIMYRSIERVDRIDFVDWSQKRVDFWAENNQSIFVWTDKYVSEE